MGSVASRRRRWGIVCFVVAGVLLLLVTAGPSASHPGFSVTENSRPAVHALPSASTVNVSMNATDAPSFQPNSLAVPNGGAVSIHLHNTGAFNHSFTLLAAPNSPVPRNATPSQLDTLVKAQGTLANVSLAPGSFAWVNLTFNVTFTNGSVLNVYEFLSIVPFQFQAGMFGFLNVTSTTPTGPAQVLFLNGTTDFHWIPSSLGVEGVTLPVKIDIGVGKIGATPHTWTLDPNPNDTTMNPSNFPQYLAANPPPPGGNVTVNPPPETFVWANFTLTKLGVYTFICEVPGHFAAGMNGSLFVNVPIPKPTVVSTAIVMPGVLIAAGVLVGVGVVLVVVATYEGRFATSSRGPETR